MEKRIGNELLSVGCKVKVIPELIREITYTNRPIIDKVYTIRIVYGGEIWTYGLSYECGGDAHIHISHKHVHPAVNEESENVTGKK